MRFKTNRLRIGGMAMLAMAASGFVGDAEAEAIRTQLNYQTQGRVYSDDSASKIDPYIRFESVLGASLEMPGTFTLGKFVIKPLPDGASVGYLYARFSIGTYFTKPGTDEFQFMTILGHLDGVLKGGHESLLRATIDYVLESPINTGGPAFERPDRGPFFSRDALKVLGPLEFTVGPNGGEFVVFGAIQPVPEPASLIVLAIAFGGFGLLRGKVSLNSPPCFRS